MHQHQHRRGEMGRTAKELCIQKGSYRGDVSALCLVPGPSYRGLLLAGTGPQVLLFDVTAKGRKLVHSLRVFDGVRIHGMDSGPAHAAVHRERESSEKAKEQENGGGSTTVVVHGERRVKVLKLSRCDRELPELRISGGLPRFNHWVADVKLLFCGGREKLRFVAIGLSNNSVSVWDLGTSAFVYRMESSERCLLYSMRLWGDTLEELRVASGTVFNEVLVWEFRALLRERQNTSSKSSKDVTSEDNSLEKEVQESRIQATSELYLSVAEQTVVVDPLQKLRGHEGSIYRIMWSADGKSLVSASDDRTARIWCARRGFGNDGEVGIDPWSQGVDSGPVLRGHGSRLWDCYLGKRFMATASEDCTCRLWTFDGRCLTTLKGHKGRGIWRCIYDPHFNVLVTGGADSSIKVHSLDVWITAKRDREFYRENISTTSSQSGLQKLRITPPWVQVGDKGRPSGFIDSKSEYVRCLLLRDAWSLYACTNQGAIYHVDIARQAEAQWTLIADALEGPIVCMDVASLQTVKGGEDFHSNCVPEDDIVVVGDGGGVVTLMHMQKVSRQCRCLWRCNWTAESKRQLLGLHLCRSVKGLHVFTTDPRGTWRLWQVSDFNTGPQDAIIACKFSTSATISDEDHEIGKEHPAQMIAHGLCGNARILCIELCPSAKIIVCGDKRGDLTIFAVPEDLIIDKMAGTEASNLDPAERKPAVQLPVIATFKGAHGISPVNSVRVIPSKHYKGVEIVSTGSDSCIGTFTLDRRLEAESQSSSYSIHCTGVRKVASTVVERLDYGRTFVEFGNTACQIASGFSSDDFLLWDATAQSEVMRVKCGGWKRPHSSLVGEIPELQQCFAFVKDHVVHVHRNWIPSEPTNEACGSPSLDISVSAELSNAQLMDQSLRSQFHGKEISSVVFLQEFRPNLLDEQLSSNIWMATGSEDETVIVSRYGGDGNEEVEPVCVLGDHVGGSAIRALALVAEPYLVNEDQPVSTGAESTWSKDQSHEQDSAVARKQELLFSAGAKEMLTCWAVDWPSNVDKMGSLDLGGNRARKVPPEEDRERSWEPSIRWLCSNSRQKLLAPPPLLLARASAEGKLDSNGAVLIKGEASGDDHHDLRRENSEEGRHLQQNARPDDDQRYLCLTAFATRCAKTGSVISFVATASSDATLCLYACHVTHRCWVELAVLEYPSALVLSMGTIAVPLVIVAGVQCETYLIITGAANGDIALWDVTDVVLKHSGSGALDVLDEGQLLRPLRGRGSQGGRHRKKEGKPGKERFKSGQHDSKDTGSSSSARTPFDCSATLPPSAYDSINVAIHDNQGSQGKQERASESSSGISGPRESSEKLEVNELHSDKKPLIVLLPRTEIKAAHQSGVNCLSVAKSLRREEVAHRRSIYTVISGGDDQDLHITVFIMVPESNGGSSRNSGKGVQDIREDKTLTKDEGAVLPQLSPVCHILVKDSMKSAHTSAVKGVWTDGVYAFSVGLDQRLRIWKIDLTCIYTRSEQEILRKTEGEPNSVRVGPPLLEEHGTVVVDVPEPASLHATVSPAGQYHIAVVGRGLQMICFDPNV